MQLQNHLVSYHIFFNTFCIFTIIMTGIIISSSPFLGRAFDNKRNDNAKRKEARTGRDPPRALSLAVVETGIGRPGGQAKRIQSYRNTAAIMTNNILMGSFYRTAIGLTAQTDAYLEEVKRKNPAKRRSAEKLLMLRSGAKN